MNWPLYEEFRRVFIYIDRINDVPAGIMYFCNNSDFSVLD